MNLLGIPVALLQKASEEYEALFRELRLMKEHADARLSPVHAPRTTLGPALGDRHPVQRLRSRRGRELAGGVDHHAESYDWHLELPPSAVEACEFYDTMLDEADEFGLVAQLLTLPASPASVAVRRWFLSELIAQLRGPPPTPWADSETRRSPDAAGRPRPDALSGACPSPS